MNITHKYIVRNILKLLSLLLLVNIVNACIPKGLKTKTIDNGLDNMINDASICNGDPFLIDILYRLRTKKASGNEKNIFNNDNTAMHYAATIGHPDIIKQLATFGANVNAKNKLHHTPLQIAITKKKLAVVFALLSIKELNPNLLFDNTPNVKISPLGGAVQDSNLEIVKALLEDSRIEVNQVNTINGKPMTPLTIAKAALEGATNPLLQSKWKAIIKALEDKGAKEQ